MLESEQGVPQNYLIVNFFHNGEFYLVYIVVTDLFTIYPRQFMTLYK